MAIPGRICLVLSLLVLSACTASGPFVSADPDLPWDGRDFDYRKIPQAGDYTPEQNARVAEASANLRESFDFVSTRDADVKLQSLTDPVYPTETVVRCYRGWVLLYVVIGKQGNPLAVKVIDSEPKGIFDDAAITAMNSARFTPPRVNGELTAVDAVFPMEFPLPCRCR